MDREIRNSWAPAAVTFDVDGHVYKVATEGLMLIASLGPGSDEHMLVGALSMLGKGDDARYFGYTRRQLEALPQPEVAGDTLGEILDWAPHPDTNKLEAAMNAAWAPLDSLITKAKEMLTSCGYLDPVS